MRREAQQRYPPIIVLALVVALAIYGLPSALNLPQANPSTVAEYAPVPGNSNGTTGNFSGSFGFGAGGAGQGGLPNQPKGGSGQSTPSTFDCVGNPPRQTQDPLSPPCVAAFSGDNGGATYQGVTSNEIRVVLYFDCCTTYIGTSQGNETMPTGAWYDLGSPAQSGEPLFARVGRVFQTYFNGRYQLYRRHAHFWAHFGTCTTDANGNCSATTSTRAADASDVWNLVHPFSVEDFATGYHEVFADVMASHGVLHFGNSGLGPGAFAGEEESFFQRYPGLIWGFDPSLQQQAALVSSFICQKAVFYPVSFSGNAGDNGKKRKFGLLETNDPAFPQLQHYAQLIAQEVQACGGNIADTGTFPSACCAISTDYNVAAQNIATFKKDGVTTVIFGGGLENQDTQVAASIGYLPEWIAAGDHGMDSNANGATSQSQVAWMHAWTITNKPFTPAARYTQCYRDWQEVTPPPPPATSDIGYGCVMFEDIRELFIGIQVAGPGLSPTSMDEGFHAIPPGPSSNPAVPACFYEAGDYNCVKDNVAEWWDPKSRDANANPGCYRLPSGGQRYLVNRWPPGNVDAQANTSSDPCNSY